MRSLRTSANRNFLSYLYLFVSINILLYSFVYRFHSIVPFDQLDYFFNAHHFFEDKRANFGEYSFLRSIGQYDAQWYLKIAVRGYPANPKIEDIEKKNVMDALTYAFAPLYPLVLYLTNYLINNIELTAFIVANLLLILNFCSLYFLIKSFYDHELAIKTTFLLFLSPLSIFFRSYFSEGLYLLLIIWFSYFFIKKRWGYLAIILALINIARPVNLLLNLLFFYYVFSRLRNKKITINSFFLLNLIVIIPFIFWCLIVFSKTGNPFYFATVQSNWLFQKSDPLLLKLFKIPPIVFIYNIAMIPLFWLLPIHYFHSSTVDVFSMVFGFIVLIKSKSKLLKKMWLIALSLFLFPLLIKDLISFSRFQIVIYPFFLFLSQIFSSRVYLFVLLIFTISLFAISTLFVNWYWIG